LDRLDAIDDLTRGTAEPRFLLNPVTQGRDSRRGPRRTPSPPLLVRVAHKPKRGKPLVALVMRRFEAADRLLLVVGEVDPRTPYHVLAEPDRPAVVDTGPVERADDVIEDFLAIQRHHRFEAVLRHHVDGSAARYRHPDLDRQMLRPRHHRDFLE